MTSSEQFLANVLTSALSGIMPYICVAVLGLRALAYLRSNFLFTKTAVTTDGTYVRVNETTSSQSGGLCLLDLVAAVFFYFGAVLNSDNRISDLPLGLTMVAFMLISLRLAIHHFRLTMDADKDDLSIIAPERREDLLLINNFAGMLAVVFMF